MGELEYLVLVEVAILMQFADGPFRGKVVLGGRSESSVNRSGEIGDHGLYLAHQFGAFALELSLDLVGCLRNELLEQVPGDVLAQAEMLGKDEIILGSLDQMQKAESRQACAAIGCNRTRNLGGASHHQNVGHVVRNRFPFRNREKMPLA